MAEPPEREPLPRRVYGTHLPGDAYRKFIGRARVPSNRWSDADPSIRILLNGLKRWEPDERR